MGFRHVLIRALLAALCALVVGSGTALAQLQTGNLYGTVSDRSGHPLPGVTVTLSGLGAPSVQVTNAQGQFRFLGLAPAGYSVQAELEGYATFDDPHVEVNVGRNTSLEIELSTAIEGGITRTPTTPPGE